MPLNVKLVVVGGDTKTTEITLKLPSTIGRGRGLAVVLPHPLVSRQHCELFESEGQLMVRDLGSLNGTFVNNERITESILGPEELLTIGTVSFRAVYEPVAGEASASSTLKEKPGEKTVKVAKGAKPAAPKAPEPQKATQDSSGPLEFDFDVSPATVMKPAAAVSPADSSRETERLAAKKPKTKEPAAAASKDQKKSTKPPPAEDESSESDFEPSASGSSDEDLNDFLDSLKDK